MYETIFLAIFICKCKGYKIQKLLKSKALLPVILVELANLINQILIFNGNYTFIKYGAILKSFYLLSFLFLIFKYELYKSALIGSFFIMIGGLLNDIAMKFNNGYMPVYPTLSYITGYIKKDTFPLINDIHILGTSNTKVKFLTDYIDLGYSILSPGDILIRIFVFIIIVGSIKESNN